MKNMSLAELETEWQRAKDTHETHENATDNTKHTKKTI